MPSIDKDIMIDVYCVMNDRKNLIGEYLSDNLLECGYEANGMKLLDSVGTYFFGNESEKI